MLSVGLAPVEDRRAGELAAVREMGAWVLINDRWYKIYKSPRLIASAM